MGMYLSWGSSIEWYTTISPLDLCIELGIYIINIAASSGNFTNNDSWNFSNNWMVNQ